jgi:hypothetical protein
LLPASADLIKSNPRDGKIYISAEDADNNNAGAGVIVYDPVANAISAWYKVGSACPGHGIDIDPVSNIAVVGCFGGTSNGDMAIDLSNGTVLKFFPDVGGTDTISFDPNNRRFYAAAGLGTATTSGCPGTLPGPFGANVPILGVIDAKGPASGRARLDGVACTGRGNHTAGVDPITNTVYVPVSQFPADPTSNTTGHAGILVFKDHSPIAQALVPETVGELLPIGSGATQVTLKTTLGRTHESVRADATNVTGQTAWLVIPTTVGNEVVNCTVDTSKSSAACADLLLGEPLIGSVATFSVDSLPVARAAIVPENRDRDDR